MSDKEKIYIPNLPVIAIYTNHKKFYDMNDHITKLINRKLELLNSPFESRPCGNLINMHSIQFMDVKNINEIIENVARFIPHTNNTTSITIPIIQIYNIFELVALHFILNKDDYKIPIYLIECREDTWHLPVEWDLSHVARYDFDDHGIDGLSEIGKTYKSSEIYKYFEDSISTNLFEYEWVNNDYICHGDIEEDINFLLSSIIKDNIEHILSSN